MQLGHVSDSNAIYSKRLSKKKKTLYSCAPKKQTSWCSIQREILYNVSCTVDHRHATDSPSVPVLFISFNRAWRWIYVIRPSLQVVALPLARRSSGWQKPPRRWCIHLISPRHTAPTSSATCESKIGERERETTNTSTRYTRQITNTRTATTSRRTLNTLLGTR